MKRCAIAVAAVICQAALPTCAFSQSDSLDYSGPHGGWNFSGTIDRPQDVNFAYRTPPVDRGGQRNRSLIRGRILQAGTNRNSSNDKARKPAQLIVNGNVMPLYTDEGGQFARPWAFGNGSNSIEIKSAQGRTLKRTQFIETNPGKAAAKT